MAQTSVPELERARTRKVNETLGATRRRQQMPVRISLIMIDDGSSSCDTLLWLQEVPEVPGLNPFG